MKYYIEHNRYIDELGISYETVQRYISKEITCG